MSRPSSARAAPSARSSCWRPPRRGRPGSASSRSTAAAPTADRLREAGVAVELFAGDYEAAATAIAAAGPATVLLNRAGRPEAKWNHLIRRLRGRPGDPDRHQSFRLARRRGDRRRARRGLLRLGNGAGEVPAAVRRSLADGGRRRQFLRSRSPPATTRSLAAPARPPEPRDGVAPAPRPAGRQASRPSPRPARPAQMERPASSSTPPGSPPPFPIFTSSSCRRPRAGARSIARDARRHGQPGAVHRRARGHPGPPRGGRRHAALRALWRILRLCPGGGGGARAARGGAGDALGRQCPARAGPPRRHRLRRRAASPRRAAHLGQLLADPALRRPHGRRRPRSMSKASSASMPPGACSTPSSPMPAPAAEACSTRPGRSGRGAAGPAGPRRRQLCRALPPPRPAGGRSAALSPAVVLAPPRRRPRRDPATAPAQPGAAALFAARIAMNLLVFLHDAFGGFGGISRFNRDLLAGLCAAPGVAAVTALPRLAPGPPEDLPAKLDFRRDGLGGRARLRARRPPPDAAPAAPTSCCAATSGCCRSPGWRRAGRARSLVLVIFGIDAWERPRNRLVPLLLPPGRPRAVDQPDHHRALRRLVGLPAVGDPRAAALHRSRRLFARPARPGARGALRPDRQAGGHDLRPAGVAGPRQGHGRGAGGACRRCCAAGPISPI